MDRLKLLEEELDTVSLDSDSAALRPGTDIRALRTAAYNALFGRYPEGITVRQIGEAEYRQLRRQGIDAYNQDGHVVTPSAKVVGRGRSGYDLTHEVTEALYRWQHGMTEALHENPKEHVALDTIIVLPVLRAADPVAYRAAIRFYETEAPAAERPHIAPVLALHRAQREAA